MVTRESNLSTKSHPTSSDIVNWKRGMPILPSAQFASCPVEASLGLLGKKWTMLILRDISMRKMERFSDLMKSINGITPRILSMRLSELESGGLIKRVETRKNPRIVRWSLTERGWDTLPILMSYIAYGSKWFAPRVFADSKPREMNEIYPDETIKELYVNLDVDRAAIRRLQKAESQNVEKSNSW